MSLTYVNGVQKWVMRIDPLNVKSFQLDVIFDPSRCQLDQSGGTTGVIYKFPFAQGATPPDFTQLSSGRLQDIAGSTTGDTLPGDVDIFELTFTDLQPGAPINGVPFTVFASSNDSIVGFDPATMQTVIFDSAQIAPTTRSVTPGVAPHIWDPDTQYNNGTTGGAGTWDTSSSSWDDLPLAPQPLTDTPWNNATHANDIAVFGGNPGSGIVTVSVPISAGGFQFDISGYTIQGNIITLSAPAGAASVIDTGANTATISSTISGNGFTKLGTGTLTLTGANTYTGSTIVSAGTFLVNNSSGSGTGNSGVLVASNGVLGGTGLISGPVDITATGPSVGGALLGGDGTAASGTLTLANNVTLSGPSGDGIVELVLGPNGAHSTLTRAGGTWTFSSNQAFTFIDLGAQPGFYHNIITGLAADPGGEASWTITNAGFAGTFSFNAGGGIDLNLTAVQHLVVQLMAAVSRKLHGSAGPFDVNLPLTGTRGVECRSSGGNHQLTFTFNSNVVSGSASVMSGGTGTVSEITFSGNTMTVNLTGVTNAQYITVNLTNVTDSTGNTLGAAAVTMGVLLGDVNGSGRVDAADVSSVRQQTLQTVTSSNFREDINASGRIDAADVSTVRQQTLTSLPSPP